MTYPLENDAACHSVAFWRFLMFFEFRAQIKTQVAIDPMDLFMPFMGQDEVWFLMGFEFYFSVWCSIFSNFSAITETISRNNLIFVNYGSVQFLKGFWIFLSLSHIHFF